MLHLFKYAEDRVCVTFLLLINIRHFFLPAPFPSFLSLPSDQVRSGTRTNIPGTYIPFRLRNILCSVKHKLADATLLNTIKLIGLSLKQMCEPAEASRA